MKFATRVCLLLLTLTFAVCISCSSQPIAPNSNSTASSSTPEIKAGPAPEFALLNAWKPTTVIVEGYGSGKYTLTAKPGTQFVAVELMMKTDDAAKPVFAAMWGGTTLVDSKGTRHQLVFSYAAPLVKYQPHGDTVEYVGSENPKERELLGQTLKETGGKLVVVFGAPENETQLKLEIAKGTPLDVSLGGK